MLRRFWLVSVLFLAALPGTNVDAEEQVCRDPLADWRVDSGELRRGAQCGTLMGTTDGAMNTYSYAQFTRRASVELPFEVEVTWRSLTNHGPLELNILGSIVLLNAERCGLFFTDESFDWVSLPGYKTQQEHTVLVRQDAKEVTLFVDGTKAHTWSFAASNKRGQIAIAMKGPRGNRARMLFRDVQVRALPHFTDNPPPPR